MTDPADVLAVVTEYPALARALADRRKELGLSQLATDAIAGFHDGYTGKLECGLKHLGSMSLPSILGALGLKLALIRDVPHTERAKA